MAKNHRKAWTRADNAQLRKLARGSTWLPRWAQMSASGRSNALPTTSSTARVGSAMASTSRCQPRLPRAARQEGSRALAGWGCGGAAAGISGCLIHHIRVVPMLNAAAVSLAVGQALGRVGCFLVGDDYGVKSDLPWAVAFPLGAPPAYDPVHPTQLYEVCWLLPVAWFLWSRRKRSPFLFGEYLALNGLGRIVIETWRVNRKIVFGITEPQLIGMGLVVVGIGFWLYFRSKYAREATSH